MTIVLSDPDKLVLTKSQMMILLDEFISELSQNKKENWEYMIEAWTIRKIFGRVKEDKFPWFWARFWEKAERFRYANTVLQDKALQSWEELKARRQPEIVSELDFSIHKILKNTVKFGAMENE